MAGIGAERKHVVLPKGFRLSLKNGHSRCGHFTARSAPNRSFGSRVEFGTNDGEPTFAEAGADGKAAP
jgi:hypothetical protein